MRLERAKLESFGVFGSPKGVGGSEGGHAFFDLFEFCVLAAD